MNMFARFDENPAITLQDIKETKRYGRMDNVKTVYPPQTKFAGGIISDHTYKVRKGQRSGINTTIISLPSL